MKLKIGIVNYGVGNIKSIYNIFKYFGLDIFIIDNPSKLEQCDKIILPGVGSFKHCMNLIIKKNFYDEINNFVNKKKPILGICVGMQLLTNSSTEEGYSKGFGFIDSKVEKFNFGEIGDNSIPHVGFNSIFFKGKNKLFKDIKEGSSFYFTHSYRILENNFNLSHSYFNFGSKFISSFEKENIYGVQFHPEKSQTNGIKLLYNFLKI